MRHTPDHVNCPACDASLQDLLITNHFHALKFKHAVRHWLDLTQPDVQPRTHRDHRDFARRLNRFFGEIYVKDIHAGNLKQYQEARAGKCADPADNQGHAGPEAINHEIASVLAKVLDCAGRWKEIKPYYKRLKVPKSTRGCSLTPDQEERLIVCAASNPRWRVAYWCTLLSVNTSCGPSEITHIRVKWIDMRGRLLSIEEGTKNGKRKREFPMTETIHYCCEQLLARYYRICEERGLAPDPEHYVLPGRTRTTSYDPWKPMGSWRSAWESLRKKADLPTLRQYDMRHQIQTKLMEDKEIAGDTICDITGSELRKPYRHIRNEKKLEALKRVEVKPAPRMLAIGEQIIAVPVRPSSASPKASQRVECPVPAKVTGTT